MNLKLAILLLLPFSNLFAQDSLDFSIPIKYELRGKHVTNSHGAKTKRNLEIPDNPIRHFAIYGGVSFKPSYKQKYAVELGLYAEERNHSGGSTLNHIVFYPKLTFSIRDTFLIFDREFKTENIGGDLWDEDFKDILRIYNLDFHGFISRFGRNNVWFSFYKVADLSYNIGLGLPEMEKISLEYEKKNFFNSLSISINTLDFFPTDYNLSNYFNYTFANKSSLTGQLETRLNKDLETGYAFGLQYDTKWRSQVLKIKYQYYSSSFNRGYTNGSQIDYSTSFSDFTGPQFYPLKNFYRPINQWALFTSLEGNNIHNVEFSSEFEKPMFGALNFIGDFDINLYHSSLGGWSYNPAYSIGINFDFGNLIDFEITATNKHMNLDSFYQGHYLSEDPYVAIEVRMNFEDNRQIRQRR